MILETFRRMATLPVSLGAHACECGHPEMRRLPDGVFHCPACGSEILPALRRGTVFRRELSKRYREGEGDEQ